MRNALKLIAAVALCEAAGAVGALFTAPAIQSGWYATLVKPALAPPAWVFGPVWVILYALMGVSLFLIWKNYSLIRPPAFRERAGTNKRIVETWRVGVALFAAQLVLNAVWPPVFFGARSIGGALALLVLLWAAIVLTVFVFRNISRPAAWLLVPYLLWVSFAAYLNYALWLLN